MATSIRHCAGIRAALLAVLWAVAVLQVDAEDVDFLMPNVQPNGDDLYLCTPMALSPRRPFYITGYKPHATMMTAHHMLLYGCTNPGDPEERVWNCGEMHADEDNGFTSGPVCGKGQSKIIYAWAKDAPALELPKGVGFEVGGDSGIEYLVLQVHYMHPLKKADSSGVTFEATNVPQPKLAGVLLMGTGGRIRAKSEVDMDTACPIRDNVELHPFAFRTHTHKLGKVVTGYRIRDGKWDLIGKHDPQKPQMFYPVADGKMVIRRGDTVAARCYMVNYLDHDVRIGATGDDEMCNFYMMYWVHGHHLLGDGTCFSPGPPFYSWSYAGLTNQPKDTHKL